MPNLPYHNMGVTGLWDISTLTHPREPSDAAQILRPSGMLQSLTHITIVDGFEANPAGLCSLPIGIDASIWFFHAAQKHICTTMHSMAPQYIGSLAWESSPLVIVQSQCSSLQAQKKGRTGNLTLSCDLVYAKTCTWCPTYSHCNCRTGREFHSPHGSNHSNLTQTQARPLFQPVMGKLGQTQCCSRCCCCAR